MSADDERDGVPIRTRSGTIDDVPSNPELDQRMTRVEEQMDHVVETVDRIDSRLTEQQNELEEAVASNTEDTTMLKSKYRLAKWTIGTAIAFLGMGGTIVGVVVTVV
ncbi:hypothetical protein CHINAEXTREME_17265 [Halobiforma lacisalsi AJ5]|uniref:Uncharacterized protein n=1 Tax=Natronobacterium lacisalsi AJ5 TaxID=358396 RepID=M0LP62_NATLA|nr:hypothetical protein [Halobiforma lacisalsi]APW99412.1 hypothetical protein CHINAEXTREME_17265 [Halobiforma lacisalsi AJ5]EMA35286.1 hypothetical protein C445_05518 [Halobiforma lacisalsi AJ5]